MEFIDVVSEEEAELLLPQMADDLNMEKQYRQIMFFYEAGIQQVTAKLEILNKEFQYCNDRNPIENIKSRVKTSDSIIGKMKKKAHRHKPIKIPAETSRLFLKNPDFIYPPS